MFVLPAVQTGQKWATILSKLTAPVVNVERHISPCKVTAIPEKRKDGKESSEGTGKKKRRR